MSANEAAKKRAWRHLRKKEYDSALEVLEQLHEQDPDDPDVRIWMGRSLRSADDVERVVELLRPLVQEGVRLRSQRVLQDALLNAFAGEQYLDAAERWLEQDDVQQAEMAVERAAVVSPRNDKVQRRCEKLRKELARRR